MMIMQPSKEAERQFEASCKVNNFVNEGNVLILPPRIIYIMMIGIVEQIMHFYGLYQNWPKVAYICNSMTILLLIIQLLLRLLSRLIRNEIHMLNVTLKAVAEFYEREEQINAHRLVLVENLKRSDLVTKIYLIFWFVMFSVLNPTAWIVSWYTSEFILFAPVFLPYTDPQTLIGYTINSIILFFFTMLVYILFMAGDLTIIFATYQCIPMTDIYCMKLKAFGEELMKFKTEQLKKKQKLKMKPQPSTSKATNNEPQISEEKDSKITIETVEQQFIVLIKEFKDYNDYMELVCSHMEFTTLMVVSTNALAIGMSIVIALYYSKAIGGTMSLFLFFQVLMPCLIGTIIEHQKEKVINELCEFPWYELSKPKRKIFLQFLHLCQHSYEFTVPIVGALDMKLFTNIMNGSYSYLMYLVEIVKKVKM